MAVSKNDINIRQLGCVDVAEALSWRMEVLGDVFAEDEPWPHDAIRAANAVFLEEHLSSDLVYGVISVGGREAGCGAACMQTELPSPDNPSGVCAYLMNIYTREAFRGEGVGHAMVSWLVSKARECGAGKIYLEATEAGHPLYESVGFKTMEGMMKLDSAQGKMGER